ncbi:S-adenosyl-L-methionine-dependent methyltransferase [Glonium stellatum]|uniref:rRNA adenine N(6)-methyltransferase n=1 Tax=Glonium stellatum TaxID=574774 RepID=A0A8E2ENF4_9PEZI|nr:S-adenosyl-L-methionine-dependent methyltransferase [Glonium stellatum]
MRLNASRKPQFRSQIVSPQLCDDIIAYIGPSLQKHKNCDILDINPGIGIWSSELHNFLQPRSHILLESQPEFYKPFLEELSNKPGSKYKLLIGDTGDFATYERLINEGQFPNQTRLNPGDPRLNQLNNTLLVTGSFAYDPVMPGLGFSSMARQVFSQFAKSAWSNELFHAYGHVRMLLWATTDDSQFLVPRSVTQPQKFPMLLQKICTTNVIASPISLPRVSGRQGASRDFRTELEGSAQVFAAMQRAGLEIPVHRRDALCTFAHKFFGKFAANSDLGVQGSLDALIEFERQGMSMQGLLPETVREQVALEEEIAKGIRKEFEIKPVTSTKKPKPILSVDGKRLARLRIQNRAAQKKREMRSALVDKAEEIYQMECFVLTTKSKAGKRETKAKLDVLNAEYKTEKNALNRLDQSLVDTEFDDRLAVRSPLHRLEWDKRSFEPLLIHDNEVWPNSRTALLDMTPKPRPEGESFRDVEYYQDILIPILANGSLTVPQALGSIAPGASQLIEEVPALRDPAKGGRLNMDHFRARMLRGEILDGLVKAYREWPFRPPETDHPKYFQAMSTGTLMLDRR